MEYINDINIQEAVIHILDSNSTEPILNENSNIRILLNTEYFKDRTFFHFIENTVFCAPEIIDGNFIDGILWNNSSIEVFIWMGIIKL